jgi:hypothetical protein
VEGGDSEDSETAMENAGQQDAASATIESRRLTTCEVVEDGRAVRLGFLDNAGDPLSVVFPFEQAESIVMTLPQLLSTALQVRTRKENARYVFPLRRWSLESGDGNFVVANLTTNDGFQVSFASPFEACKSIGWTLNHQGSTGLAQQNGAPAPVRPAKLN